MGLPYPKSEHKMALFTDHEQKTSPLTGQGFPQWKSSRSSFTGFELNSAPHLLLAISTPCCLLTKRLDCSGHCVAPEARILTRVQQVPADIL